MAHNIDARGTHIRAPPDPHGAATKDAGTFVLRHGRITSYPAGEEAVQISIYNVGVQQSCPLVSYFLLFLFKSGFETISCIKRCPSKDVVC